MYTPNDEFEKSYRNDPVQNRDSHTEQTNPQAPGSETGASAQSQPVPPANVTYHTGPIHSGSAYMPAQNRPAYGQPGSQPAFQQPVSRPAGYTWNPQGGSPVQPGSYYAPVQPPKPKKKKKGGKFWMKLLAAVLACAVVSMGSVGAFVLMIQNGLVRVETQGESGKTAAFTIYRQAEDSSTAAPAVTSGSMTPQQVAEKLVPSVVCVQNYQITRQNGLFFGFGYGGSEDSSLSPAGEGSGIVLSKDGYIVTNQHVIDGATSLKVVTSEGLTYEAELVGEDTQTDLAVIKVDADVELTPAEFGSSQDLKVADEVIAIGNPGGLQLNSSCTFGRISALNRPITSSSTGYTMHCIQTDASINPGNSGGALVDMNGHVVGINSSKIVDTRYEGLGFAIPADTAQPIVSDLIEYGYVKDRAMPGFVGQYVDQFSASFYGLTAGYYVSQVNSEKAQASGLQRGDVITAVDGTQITSDTTISNYLVNKKPGDMVTLTVNRALTGETGLQLEMTLSENTGASGQNDG